MPSAVRLSDGSFTFEGGIDAGRTPTIQSPGNPIGLKRNQVAWAQNCVMRGGGLGNRPGWIRRTLSFSGDTALETAFKGGKFQGGKVYIQSVGFPYLVLSLSGRLFRVQLESAYAVDELTSTDVNNPLLDKAWLEQAEEFLVVQDGQSRPFIWDGSFLRRANGAGPNPEVPVGTAMDYYMGRLWVARGRTYGAGDIVGGPNGTVAYNYRDSVLKWIENTYLAGGGSFTVPLQCGEITGLSHTANLDTSLGEGELMVFTRKNIFATRVPALRSEWVSLSEPLQRVAQIGYGGVSQESIVQVNGDLHYRSMDGIRSHFMAIRDFSTWGNTPISREVTRILKYDDRSLLRYSSGMLFDNRLYQTCSPLRNVQGIIHKGLLVLDFDLIGSLSGKSPPAWEGMHEGLDILQVWSADFGGLERAFALALNGVGELELWELSTVLRNDLENNRIIWSFETPAYTAGNQAALKQLDGLDIWIDRLFGPTDFRVYYRPDQYPCWTLWHAWRECAVRNPCEDPDPPSCYVMQSYQEQYRPAMSLPTPPDECNGVVLTPLKIGYQFQFRIEVEGNARIRGLLAHFLPRESQPFRNITC